jgi:hypothetical protein
LLVIMVHLCYGAGVLGGLLGAGRPRTRLGSDAAPVRWLSEEAEPS